MARGRRFGLRRGKWLSQEQKNRRMPPPAGRDIGLRLTSEGEKTSALMPWRCVFESPQFKVGDRESRVV